VSEERCGEHVSETVLLGTGTPNAEPDRSGPSVAIVAGDTPYIVDCGPGAWCGGRRRLRRWASRRWSRRGSRGSF